MSSATLYYRTENPALIIQKLILHPNLRKRKLGNVLVDKLEITARNLGCENRIFLTQVTNPSFWTHKGYAPMDDLGHWQIAR